VQNFIRADVHGPVRLDLVRKTHLRFEKGLELKRAVERNMSQPDQVVAELGTPNYVKAVICGTIVDYGKMDPLHHKVVKAGGKVGCLVATSHDSDNLHLLQANGPDEMARSHDRTESSAGLIRCIREIHA
jgi:hypothetical protein